MVWREQPSAARKRLVSKWEKTNPTRPTPTRIHSLKTVFSLKMLMQGRFCAIFPEVLFGPLKAQETVLTCSTWTGATVANVPWRKMHPEPAGAGWWCSPVKDPEPWWCPCVPGESAGDEVGTLLKMCAQMLRHAQQQHLKNFHPPSPKMVLPRTSYGHWLSLH